jgi:pimeloyl-ACP methyl ester carboxylesterase
VSSIGKCDGRDLATRTVTSDFIAWNYGGRAIRVGLDRLGEGPAVLLLPALSSISTRREMRPLQGRLAPNFATVTIDWPGFGDEPRPKIAWAPSAHTNFLQHLLAHIVPNPLATIAAGHAASYALVAAANMLLDLRQAAKIRKCAHVPMRVPQCRQPSAVGFDIAAKIGGFSQRELIQRNLLFKGLRDHTQAGKLFGDLDRESPG